jgi:hypothetical protein
MACRVPEKVYPLINKTPYLVKSGAAGIVFWLAAQSMSSSSGSGETFNKVFVIREKSCSSLT